MPQNFSLPDTETLVAKSSSTSSRYTYTGSSKQSKGLIRLGHGIVAMWAAIAALATMSQSVQTRFMERATQSFFFNRHGSVAPARDIVILAIDDYSLDPSQAAIPQTNGAAIKLSYPIKRSIYADVIDRLIQGGARAVAIDLLFADPSSYGPADDQRLLQTLQKYPGRVVLAASYGDSNIRQGDLTQFLRPLSWVPTLPVGLGTINFWTEPNHFWTEPEAKDGIVYRFGSQFPILSAKANPAQASYFNQIRAETPSFAEATLKAARVNYPPPKGENIFFYGAQDTFKEQNPSQQVSFRDVLDPENWNSYLNKGAYFKNKIVVIGSTAASQPDFVMTPFGTMTGVELHANAMATLLENRSIAEVFPNPLAQGGVVLVLVAAAGFLQSSVLGILSSKRLQPQLQRSLVRFILAAGLVRFLIATSIALTWGGIGYVAFVYGRAIVPVAVPIAGILLSGVTYLVTATVSEYLGKLQLLKILAQFPRSEVVQRILSEYVEFQELLQEPEQAFAGKILANRYQITKVLGAGGFGKTYIAEDRQRPGNPICVVKQLKPANDTPNLLQLAHKLFRREANTLEALGEKSQGKIPKLLASFEEEGEFYLVQEYIPGQSLSQELSLGKRLPEARVVAILQEILQILQFVHSQDVIHRDIKPSNIIRRETDRKLVLIDFGAVKITDQTEDQSGFTIGIGTKGYMPNEQSGGKPRPNSDIFAVGMIGIQALTGLFPNQIREKEDPKTGKIDWRDRARVSHVLAEVLDRMIHYDYQRRYQTAGEVLDDLAPLAQLLEAPNQDVEAYAVEPILDQLNTDYSEGETRHWSEAVGPSSATPDVPPTRPVPRKSDPNNLKN